MKKGMIDLLFIPIFILIIVVGVFLGLITLTSFLNEAQNTEIAEFIPTDDMNNIVKTLDYILPIFVVGVGVVMLALSFLVDAHPLYYVISIVVLLTGVVTGAVVSNLLVEFNEGTAEYTGTALPITKQMIGYVPYFVLAIAVISAIAFYGKFGTAGGGNEV